MTHTIPLIHKYRFFIAILLAAFVSTSMIVFKPTQATAVSAVSDTESNASYYIAPAVFKTPHETPIADNGAITAIGKVTFERPMVTTIPAPKKETPAPKQAEDTKPDSAPVSNAAPVAPSAPVAAPAATQSPTTASDSSSATTPQATTTNSSAPVTETAVAPMAGTSPAAAQAFARSYLAGKGLGDAEFQCLVTLWNRESGWNFQATNSGSGAYGIPQSLPGSKMASAGADWQTNPQTQIIWGLGYIIGRYGTPCGAVAVWDTRGWY
jgi:hypothetical protein